MLDQTPALFPRQHPVITYLSQSHKFQPYIHRHPSFLKKWDIFQKFSPSLPPRSFIVHKKSIITSISQMLHQINRGGSIIRGYLHKVIGLFIPPRLDFFSSDISICSQAESSFPRTLSSIPPIPSLATSAVAILDL